MIYFRFYVERLWWKNVLVIMIYYKKYEGYASWPFFLVAKQGNGKEIDDVRLIHCRVLEKNFDFRWRLWPYALDLTFSHQPMKFIHKTEIFGWPCIKRNKLFNLILWVHDSTHFFIILDLDHWPFKRIRAKDKS